MTMTSLSHDPRTILERAVRGTVLTPEHPGYLAAVQGWNLTVRQRPALVVRAASRHDVATSVRFARSEGLGVAVMATGHGVVTPCDGGLLLDTSALRSVRVSPRTRRVRVAAGTRWQEVAEALRPHGLAGLAGSSPHIGVVGYSLGGGFGWLGRRFGLASHHLTRAEIVTADGRVRRVSPAREPELFWGLAGGTGNFGIVTALEFRAHRLTKVFGGNLFYPISRLGDVATFFAGWAPELPDTVTAALTVVGFPPAPTVPEPLRGKRMVALRAVWSEDLPTGRAVMDGATAYLGSPVMDTFAEMSPAALGSVSADPVDPLPIVSQGELIADLDDDLIAALVSLVGPEDRSPLGMLELRTLGGALRGRHDQLSPMARTDARYSLYAGLLAGVPGQEGATQDFFTRLSAAVRGRATGDNYVNFLNSHGGRPPRVRAAYSTADWDRLVALKHEVDPDDLFRFNRNISADT